jgi:hypothetical protein
MSTFSKLAAKATRAARAEAKRALSRTALMKNPAVKAAFEALPLNLRKGATLSIGYSSVYITLYMHDLTSFKDKRLTNVLERFIDWPTRVNEYTSGAPNKDFMFEKRMTDPVAGNFELSVTVYSYVKSDSPLCRVVVTGMTERIVREETKQIICA